jgi:hypothetical protein
MFCYFFIKKKVKERKGKPDFSVASQARLHRNDLIDGSNRKGRENASKIFKGFVHPFSRL